MRAAGVRAAGPRGRGAEGPRLWITDFGLARISTPSPLGGEGRGEGASGDGASLTMTGDILGTLRYMSPEQLQAKHGVLDHRTDVYSLGLTLYELMTLQPAFPGDDRQNLIRQIAEADPRPPRQVNKSIPKDLETIILKATAKEPQSRYATAQQLADDLRRFLQDEPIRARRPTLLERSRKWARRHRAVVWSAVASLLMVLVILGISGLLVLAAYQGEKEQRAAAEANAKKADANAAQAQRNYETARKAIKQMVTRVGNDQLAKIPEMREVRRRVLEDAAAFYTELLKLSPRDPHAYFERGQVYHRLVQYDKVRADYEKASELEPDNAEFHGALAGFLGACPDVARRDLQSGLLHAKWAVRLEPRNLGYHYALATVYLNLGENDKAVAEMRQAAELTSNPIIRDSYLARACSIAGDLEGALEWSKKALALAPNRPGTHEGMGELYVRLGQYENAIVSTTKAIELSRKIGDDSADDSAWRNYLHRGDAYAGLRMYRQALADYDRSLELAPFRSYAYKRRALAHFHLKNYDKALADIAKAGEVKPDDVSNLTWIPVDLQAKCPDERFRRGILELADKTIQSNQGGSGAYVIRATLHATFGYRKEALADLEKAGGFDRGSAELYVTYYGLLSPDRDRLDQAVADLRRAARLTDEISPAWLPWVSCWLPAAMQDPDNLPGIVFVSDLPWVRSTCGWGPREATRNSLPWGEPVPIAGLPYSKAICTWAFDDERAADVVLDTSQRTFATFKAHVGLRSTGGSVQFQVLVDGNVKHETPVLRPSTLQTISVDVAGAKQVVLRVLNGGDGNNCDEATWGFARFVQAGAVDPLEEPGEIRSATDANAALFLATVHWRLDQKERARRWHDKAIQWMDKNQTEAEKLRPFRAEAEELLGIKDKPPSTKEPAGKPQ